MICLVCSTRIFGKPFNDSCLFVQAQCKKAEDANTYWKYKPRNTNYKENAKGKQYYKEADDTKLMIKKRIVAYSKTLTGTVLFFLLLTKL